MKNTKRIGIRIDNNTLIQLKAISKKQNFNISECIRELIKGAYKLDQ